jgi:hypothetical protein
MPTLPASVSTVRLSESCNAMAAVSGLGGVPCQLSPGMLSDQLQPVRATNASGTISRSNTPLSSTWLGHQLDLTT